MDEDRILAAIAESSRDNRQQIGTLRMDFHTELTAFRTEVMSRFERSKTGARRWLTTSRSTCWR